MSESNLPALQAELARIGAEAAEWAKVEASDSTALVRVGSADPEKIREQMVEVRREAREKARALQAAADEVRTEIRRELDRQRAEMEAQMRAAMEALAPLQEQIKRMEEGIWTVSLYLGVSEEIVTLRTGQPAPPSTPIHLRTSVLAMDEEVASFPKRHGDVDWQGMDWRDIGTFDRWLVEDPAHLAQVLPEERGIVVFTPRRTEKIMHEDPLVNAALNQQNFESYWLIRNGENLYRMQTDFAVGRSLMPVTSEFTALFRTRRFNRETREYETVDITPGSREWAKAEEAQDAKRRHYMRVALITQGLIDRTEVFAPLHEAVNVMRQSTYDDGLVVVIDDTDKAIGTGREPYFDWIRRLNRDLRPGMRIIGNFQSGEFDSDRRVTPSTAKRPPSNVLHLIEGRKDEALVIRYERVGEEVYDPNMWVETRPGWGYQGGYRAPTRRASATIEPSDTFVIPFDLVTIEEMQEYLDARTERHAYAKMFPLLQAAVTAKMDEVRAEAPFRDLLRRVLAEDTGQTLEEVDPHIDGLVHRFKVGNRWHRPLVSLSQEEEAKALRLIRAEYKRIADSGATERRDQQAVDTLRDLDETIMFVGRLSSGKYVAFAPQPRTYGEGVAAQNLWVTEYTTGKTARSIAKREWVAPGVRGSKMTVLYSAERWADWDTMGGPKTDLTDEEMDATLAQVRQRGERTDQTILAIEHQPETREWKVWRIDAKDKADRDRYRWDRTPNGLSLNRLDTEYRVDDFELSYAGNHMLDKIPPSSQRSVYMPWHEGQRRSHWEKEGEQRPRPTVVWEADAETLATVEARVRAREDAVNEDRRIRNRIEGALRDIVDQQEQVKVAAIKADFLARFPDEEAWEEKRGQATKGVRPDLDVTDQGWHFMVRGETVHDEEEGFSHTSMHDREGYRSLRDTLRALTRAGATWEGLTVRDAYRLADAPWPDVYEPIGHLILNSDDS